MSLYFTAATSEVAPYSYSGYHEPRKRLVAKLYSGIINCFAPMLFLSEIESLTKHFHRYARSRQGHTTCD